MIPRSMAGAGAVAALVALCGAGGALAQGSPAAKEAAASKPEEAAIHFANHGGIYDWQADGDQGMWVQDVHRHWYYGRFMSPCIGLQFAEAVRFRTGPSDVLDRWSSVRAHGTGNCAFVSFVKSEGPPRKASKKAAGTAANGGAAAPAAPANPPPPPATAPKP